MRHTLNFEQVWEVQLWKNDPSKGKILVSYSRLSLVCNIPMPERGSAVSERLSRLKKYAKL